MWAVKKSRRHAADRNPPDGGPADCGASSSSCVRPGFRPVGLCNDLCIDSNGACSRARQAVSTVHSHRRLCLQERCTKLERALQAAKSAAAAAGESASTSAAEVQALTQQLQQSQQLVRQLESDLLALSSSSSSGAAEGAGLGAAVRLGGSGLQGFVPAGLDAAAGVSSPSAAAAAGPGQEGGGGDGAAAVLQAVAAQRDRFKARIAELEGEQAGLSAQLQQAAAQVQSVTQDNVALVEKLRWGCGVLG